MPSSRSIKSAVSWQVAEPVWLEVNGARLHGRCFGPPPDKALTIVLLHEGLGSVALWRDFPSQLTDATGCGVFAYDRFGYGQSDPVKLPRPLDYMTREAIEVLPKVLDGIGLQRGILLGHSDGASIAAIHAGIVGDERISGVVLMAPHFFTEPQGLASIAEARIAYDKGDLKPRLAKYHSDVDNAFRGWNDAWLDPGFEAWNIEHVIGGITVPVLAIQGNEDQYGTVCQIDALRERHIASLEVLMLNDCFHAPFAEKPQQTLAGIARFVTG